jgi:hypothetical protein
MSSDTRRMAGPGWLAGLLAATALVLAGCAGTDFVRPDPGSFALGSMTQADISQRMGKPYRAGTLEKNGKTLQTSTYAYASFGESLYPGITPSRSQGFYFFGGKLVGTEFTSSFKADGTDFDESKVSQIEKGKSTRADVVRLLGPAGGDYMTPLITGPTDRALVYTYSQARGSAFNMRFYSKSLVVVCNEAGVVTDVQYTAQGQRD